MSADRMIGCSEAVERLWEFLDQSLTDVDRRAVEEHLAFCVRCCGELEFARELRRRLRTAGPGALPADVEERLGRFVDGLGRTEPGGVT